MGAAPVVESEVQDELSAALEASRDPGKVVEDPEPEPEPEPKPEAKKESVKEEAKAEEKKEEVKEKDEPKDDLFDVNEQNRELRQILRQQKRDLSVMQAKLARLEKRSAEASKKVEDEVDDSALFGKPEKKVEETKAAEEVAPVEVIQQELLTIAKVKGPILETLLETMELNPTYSDVRDVCSQANFDDIFEAIGDAVAAKEGKDASLVALEAEAAVWKMPNPYKYMYGLIKKYHPKYADRQPSTKEDKKDSGKKPAEAPSSIAAVSGKSAPSNAWTAARIDELDEMELDKVPAEIYQKYLRGDLD